MIVLKVDEMKCGTKLQLEHWESLAHLDVPVDIVAAYPKAKESMPGIFAPKRGQTFRLAIGFNSNKEAEQVYGSLLNGSTKLLDHTSNFSEKEFARCL